MIRTATGFMALLAVLPVIQAQDKAETPTPGQRYQTLVKEYQTAQQEFNKAYKEAKTPEDKQKMLQEKRPQPSKFASHFLELAEQNPKDPVSLDALAWVVSEVPLDKGASDGPKKKALKMLLRDHVQSEKMTSVCQTAGYSLSEESKQLLRAVLEKNKYRSAQAQACFALAQQAERRLGMASRLKDQPAFAKRYEEIAGKEIVEALVKADPEKLSKEAEAFYKRVVKDFADVSDPRGGTLGKLAEDKLEAMHHPILVGKAAPEIDGEDLDGKKFKLSDYRGKVVLLDFWGNW